jgi:hypothetical protein
LPARSVSHGGVSDRERLRPRRLAALFAMDAEPHWPLWAIFALAMVLGATADGWNGVFLAFHLCFQLTF